MAGQTHATHWGHQKTPGPTKRNPVGTRSRTFDSSLSILRHQYSGSFTEVQFTRSTLLYRPTFHPDPSVSHCVLRFPPRLLPTTKSPKVFYTQYRASYPASDLYRGTSEGSYRLFGPSRPNGHDRLYPTKYSLYLGSI